MAKLLFLSKRARPDILTTISFLTTWMREPDEDEQKKLARALKYLNTTKDLLLTLECDGTGSTKWWVDAEFAVHHSMWSHTGGIMSLGKGVMYSASMKKKLNTKSSTEAELVGINHMMPQILWMRYFLESQGFTVSDIFVYQDNQISMKLDNNGQGSIGR